MDPEIKKFSQKSERVLTELFNRAKSKDEFEFLCTLMRFTSFSTTKKGITIFQVSESKKMISEVTDNFLNKTFSFNLKVRLGLLLYGHILEMQDLYASLENLLNVCRGTAYDHSLFSRKKNIDNHINKICSLAEKLGLTEFPALIYEFYSKGLRDSFFHADYLLEDKKYILLRGKRAKFKNLEFQELDFDNELIPILQRAINFALAYFRVREANIKSYDKQQIFQPKRSIAVKALKVIPIPNGISTTLLVDSA